MSLVVVGGRGLRHCGQLSPYVGVGTWLWSLFVVRAWFSCMLFEGDVAPAYCVKKSEGRDVG